VKRMAENEIPAEWASFLTARQSEIMAKLDAEGIKWVFQDTAGGCNALVVLDESNYHQVVITNCEDDDDHGDIFVVDATSGKEPECALFAVWEEVWGEVVYTSHDIMDFINVARFLTQTESDPFEHYLADGRHVVDLFT